MTGSLLGKTAFITGGARGLGLETARQLAQRGALVIIGARDAAKAESAAELLRSEGGKVKSIKLDVSAEEDRQAAYDYFVKHADKLDILINNAGVWLESESASVVPPNRTSETSADILRKTFETNFFSVVQLTQRFLPLIRNAPAGRIVNLSSMLGSLTLHSDPASRIYSRKAFAYDASKTALNAFTVHLAHELRETSVKVNSAHPGWVRSDMGGSEADLDLVTGSQTAVRLATLPSDGPTGGFFFFEDTLPW
jgi:NAD(P)-dependent dehydrogenase (short-subunit alcohol dehydrogenase family)